MDTKYLVTLTKSQLLHLRFVAVMDMTNRTGDDCLRDASREVYDLLKEAMDK